MSRHRRAVPAIVTALALPVLALGYFWSAPAACQVGKAPWLYRWTCLFPGLLIVVPPVLAGIFAVGASIDARRRSAPERAFIPRLVLSGIGTQLVCMAGYAVILDPAYREAFFATSALVPQPFAAGAVAAATYELSRRRAPGPTASSPD